jgi:hypothetical protein
MNASKAGHEAFINYITTGKPITGSASSIDRSLEGVDSATGFRSSLSSPRDQSPAQANRSLISPSSASLSTSSASLSTSPQLTKKTEKPTRLDYPLGSDGHAAFLKASYQWKEDNLSPELKAKKASQANLDRLSYEGKGTVIGEDWHGNSSTKIKTKGARFDAEDKARQESIKERGGWLGQLNRALMGKGKFRIWSRDLTDEERAATVKVKQAGAEAIGKYYSSSDGKYYANYDEAVKARKKRLAVLAKEQAAAKNNPTITPPVKPKPTVQVKQNSGDSNQAMAEPSGRNNIPPFSATTAKANTKTNLLGLLTGSA